MMENWDAFVKFVKEVRAGALATVDGNKPHVRAMVFTPLGEEGIIYTTTNCSTGKVNQIRKNPNVAIFIWKGHSFFRAEGKAEISEDLAVKKKILDVNPAWKKHYPGGAEDPNYCLIRIEITRLEKNLEE